MWSAAVVGAEGGLLPPTKETDIGIYYVPGAPEIRNLWQEGDPGERLLLRGRVLTTDGAPVPNAQVELWHADGTGLVHPDRYRTRLRTRANGGFGVTTALPGYIPGAPGVWGARHIHVVVTHPVYAQLISLILFKGDPNLVGLSYPELAVFVEQGRIKDQDARFAEVELILPSN
jgi:catechol 1,2-dioxygenase